MEPFTVKAARLFFSKVKVAFADEDTDRHTKRQRHFHHRLCSRHDGHPFKIKSTHLTGDPRKLVGFLQKKAWRKILTNSYAIASVGMSRIKAT